jgi:hypothetical protein
MIIYVFLSLRIYPDLGTEVVKMKSFSNLVFTYIYAYMNMYILWTNLKRTCLDRSARKFLRSY